MANTADSFTIDVNINGGKTSPTSPTRRSKKWNPTTISGILKGKGVKNHAVIATIAGSAISLGKTYIDLQFSKSENANQAKRFNFALKTVGYVSIIAGGAAKAGVAGGAAGGIYVAASITGDILTYNTKLKKKQIRFDYTNEKYQQSIANGSRWRGGSL
jgi:hypothetical protein